MERILLSYRFPSIDLLIVIVGYLAISHIWYKEQYCYSHDYFEPTCICSPVLLKYKLIYEKFAGSEVTLKLSQGHAQGY